MAKKEVKKLNEVGSVKDLFDNIVEDSNPDKLTTEEDPEDVEDEEDEEDEEDTEELEKVETRGRKRAPYETRTESCTVILKKSTYLKLKHLAYNDYVSFNEVASVALDKFVKKSKVEFPSMDEMERRYMKRKGKRR